MTAMQRVSEEPQPRRRLAGIAPPTAPLQLATGTRAHLSWLQAAAGNRAVQRLIRLTDAPRPPQIVSPAALRGFVEAELPRRQRGTALRVVRDLAATSDTLEFSSRSELRDELVKRVTMTEVMQASQHSAGGLAPFGYPFTGASRYWGPRVGFAAKDYWVPPTPDDYDLRRDPAKRTQLRTLPRGLRHTVYGDQAAYRFGLSATGRTNPYDAIHQLFVPQPAHKRTLVHCDYLVSLVHFRAFMASLGKAAFNARISAYGPDRIVLKWDLFAELEPTVFQGNTGASRPGLGSIHQVTPASPRDLVIGDHVYFWNHPAYDVINDVVGNAWRLENAILIARAGNDDVFLGHGSGRRTAAEMRNKLAEEYNDVANEALALVRRTRRGSASQRAASTAALAARFPGVKLVGAQWRIIGRGLRNVPVDMPLGRLRASDIPGLYDPAKPGQLYTVRRAAESG